MTHLISPDKYTDLYDLIYTIENEASYLYNTKLAEGLAALKELGCGLPPVADGIYPPQKREVLSDPAETLSTLFPWLDTEQGYTFWSEVHTELHKQFDKETAENKSCLDEIQSIRSNRVDSYGKPEDNFKSIAEVWNWYLDQKSKSWNEQHPMELGAQDVGRMMALLKVARMQGGQDKKDNYVDAANYLIIAGDML